MDQLSDDASEKDIRALIESNQSAVRAKFLSAFPAEIEAASQTIARSYGGFRQLERYVHLDKRSAYVEAYAYAAFNSLLTSTNLLLSGLLLPSGNLMRHYGEACAMALLCSDGRINTFDLLERDPHTFPYQNALGLVERHSKLLGIQGPEWKTFRELTQFYNRFSHASVFALATQFMFSTPGHLAVLGEFDADKVWSYAIELRRRSSAGNVLTNLCKYFEQRLPPKLPDEPPPMGAGVP